MVDTVFVTEAQVQEALNGVRVKIPASGGAVWVLWVTGSNLSLTKVAESDII